MRKLILSLIAIAIVANFFSCMLPCEADNTGDITVTNSSDRVLWFDVTTSEGTTNENRELQSGASTTYTMPTGNIKVWASKTNTNSDFIVLETRSLSQCATDSYSTASEVCSIFKTTDIKVVNGYNFSITVDVWVDGIDKFLGERVVGALGSTTYYDVPAGSGFEAEFWATAGDGWSLSDYYSTTVCQLFTFTWSGKKSADISSPQKSIELGGGVLKPATK